MNKNFLSPYIRTAMYSTIHAPHTINNRIIYDYEIILVSGGKCKITIDGKEYIVKEKDIVLLRPDVVHKFQISDNTNFVQPHIHFDLIYNEKSEETPISFKSKKSMSEYELSLIQQDLLKSYNIPYVFRATDEKAFGKLFFEIIDLYVEKKFNYEVLCKAKMLELLHLIFAQFEPDKVNQPTVTNDIITSVKDYIDNNFLSNISLDNLSLQFSVNKFTLMRKFNKIYKQNIISYYHDKRMEYAKKMLESSKLSMGAIAEKMSFSDIYSFSRFFKNNEGISPTEYRKKTT